MEVDFQHRSDMTTTTQLSEFQDIIERMDRILNVPAASSSYSENSETVTTSDIRCPDVPTVDVSGAVRVDTGIDEDLKLILDMDPSIIDGRQQQLQVPPPPPPPLLPPRAGGSPTFKTAMPTYRTQLRLQLMREQLQQQERREAELRQQQLEHRLPPPTPALKVPLSIQNVDVPPQVLQVRTGLENPTRYHVIQKQKSQVRQYLSESFQQPSDFINGGNQVHSAPSLLNHQVIALSPENAVSPSLSSIATSTDEYAIIWMANRVKLNQRRYPESRECES